MKKLISSILLLFICSGCAITPKYSLWDCAFGKNKNYWKEQSSRVEEAYKKGLIPQKRYENELKGISQDKFNKRKRDPFLNEPKISEELEE